MSDIAIFGSTDNANEFAIEWIRGRNYAGVTAPSGSALKNKILRLKESHPDDITHFKENKDGSIFCHIPVNYVKISPPRKISEEQRRIASERFKKLWEEKNAEECLEDFLDEELEEVEDVYEEDLEEVENTFEEEIR